MKIWLILCLAAGPLAIRAQQPGGSILMRLDQAHANGWLDTASFGWRRPALELPNSGRLRMAGSWGLPVFPDNLHLPRRESGLITIYLRDSMRILLPDNMACLIVTGTDPMPVDRRKGRDPMPNGMKAVTRETKP